MKPILLRLMQQKQFEFCVFNQNVLTNPTLDFFPETILP